jgi:hypothetical protein
MSFENACGFFFLIFSKSHYFIYFQKDLSMIELFDFYLWKTINNNWAEY